MKPIFIVFMLLFISACSTNLSKGNNMMEAEQYDEAVRYYEKAMLDDPGDTEVATKLYEARTRMVMANLIKVRLQRQSNQHRAAAIQLNTSLYNIKRWKIVADSGVKATIEEEVLEGGIWLNKELNYLASRKDHNGFFYSLKQFEYILASGLADKALNTHKDAMQAQGQQQCRTMKKQLTAESHFLHGVWQDYCAVFSLREHYQLSKDSTRFQHASISSSRLKVSSAAGISKNQIAKHVEKSISNNPWFSSEAKSPLKLSLSGRINYSVHTTPKTFHHKYVVYKETLELIKDPKNPKKVIRKLIKRKGYPKSTTFPGKEYTETYSHQVDVKANVMGYALQAQNQIAREKNVMTSHNTYFKSEGIHPVKPRFKNKQKWKNKIANSLAKQLNKNLNKAWVDQYCTDQNIDQRLSKNEYAVRCALYRPNHGVVKGWTQSEFSLSLAQLNIMFGK